MNGPAHGSRVILALIGGTVLFAVAVLGGFIFLRPEEVPCASGEAALNPTVQPGVSLPLTRTLSSVEEAEAFVCHSLPVVTSPDVELKRIEGFRSGSLQDVVEGRGFAEVSMTYTHNQTGEEIVLLAAKSGSVPPDAPSRVLTSGEIEVVWQKDGLDLALRSRLNSALTREQLDAIRNSIR
jgi:hypothetical protein